MRISFSITSEDGKPIPAKKQKDFTEDVKRALARAGQKFVYDRRFELMLSEALKDPDTVILFIESCYHRDPIATIKFEMQFPYEYIKKMDEKSETSQE